MDEDIKKRLDAQDVLLEQIYKSAETTRKYFQWTLIISVVVIVLPIFGLLFLIPKVIGIFSGFPGLVS